MPPEYWAELDTTDAASIHSASDAVGVQQPRGCRLPELPVKVGGLTPTEVSGALLLPSDLNALLPTLPLTLSNLIPAS